MYVYLGKFNWKGAAVAENETFVVILPNGPVRAGDTAYVFFQWTRDEYSVPKANWFQTIFIDKVFKNDKGDDVFTLNHPKFSWEITSQQAYEKIHVAMSDTGSTKSTTTLKREWGTQTHGGKAKDTVRVWTGKINWYEYAKNEMAIFIAPEGFGEGRPVASVWQWTKDAQGTLKAPSLHCEYQKVQSDEGGKVRFTYSSYYELTCSFNQQNGKLSVHMNSPREKRGQDLGEFALATMIDRHSHDFTPSESAPNKAETEFRLPQPQPSLPHILSPMPFPRTLFETLTHTAAFVNQAGYLAKYAEEQFNTLDSEFHLREQRLATATGHIRDLKEHAKTLEGKIAEGQGKAAELEKTLAETRKSAAAREAELNRKIEQTIKENDAHDKKDHAVIDKLRKQIDEERQRLNDEISSAKIQLDTTKSEVAATKAMLAEERTQRSILEGKKRTLEDQLKLSEEQNKDLRARASGLESDKDKLNKKLLDLQKLLEVAKDGLAKTEAELDSEKAAVKKANLEKDQALSDLENEKTGHCSTKKEARNALVERDLARKARDEAAKARDKANDELKRMDDERREHEKQDREHEQRDREREEQIASC